MTDSLKQVSSEPLETGVFLCSATRNFFVAVSTGFEWTIQICRNFCSIVSMVYSKFRVASSEPQFRLEIF